MRKNTSKVSIHMGFSLPLFFPIYYYLKLGLYPFYLPQAYVCTSVSQKQKKEIRVMKHRENNKDRSLIKKK